MQTGNDDQSSLERLLNAAHPCISIVTQEERHDSLHHYCAGSFPGFHLMLQPMLGF